ncbi:MAG: hypothetical protein IAE80_02880, partial [Anaerolinea sp.]|nr:hypothetical protein [Anaerolinea sp.]
AWHLIWAAASGMETPIFAMFTLLLIWLALRQVTANQPSSPVPFSLKEKGFRGSGLLSAVSFGAAAALTTLTRPEGVLLVGMIGVTLLIVRPSAKTLVWGMAAGIAFGIVLAPYLILNYNLTGGLLPNTAAAKRMYATPLFAQDLLWRFNVMLTPLLAGGQLLLIPGVIAFIVMLVRRDRAALIGLLLPAWAFGLILLYAVTLPLNFQHGRYVIPALPAWITAGVIGTAWLLRWSSGALLPRVVSRVLAISAALLFVWFVFGIGLTAHVLDVTIIEEEMVTAAHWLAENVPPADLLAVNDIGAVGYFASRPILDIAGLVTPEVIPIKYDNAALWTFLQENGALYLMAMADQIPGAADNMPALCSVFSTGGTAAVRAGGTNMTIYLLDWDHALPCP